MKTSQELLIHVFTNNTMKNYMLRLALALTALSSHSFAQVPYSSAVPNGYTKKAVVSEQVGLTQVTITYHRPAVRGREGKIWGEVVHKQTSGAGDD